MQFRWPLGLPLLRKMAADLWEIRTNLGGGNIARVFFTVRNTRMVLSHGIEKKSQKTPRQEFELARVRRNQWHDEV
uniref:Phage derived protein Gp49-like (DUF891) n=1 Tax=Candidatus Kentrum sp. SD TaxID=2126332 RepID=A0A451BK43_9GAMM|nr:MAG: Phage derived protein Gp49-like (DUF891) [Candidatus Kentron sp. SD]